MSELHELAENLRGRGFEVWLAADRDAARELVLAAIPAGASVSWGGSVTLDECGLREALRQGPWNNLEYIKADATPAEARSLRKQGFEADHYLCSANAIALQGAIVNVDGYGNRVAATAFGPGKVWIVAGRNKLAADLHAAIRRVKEVAAPKNCVRLEKDTGCAATGSCTGFDPEVCICRITSIMEARPSGTQVAVLLVDEELGY